MDYYIIHMIKYLLKYRQFSIWTIVIFLTPNLHAETRTITADVTGDNMYDAIKVTDDAVYVVDKMLCCTKQRFPIISGCDTIFDVLVGDFSSINRSNEVAIVFGKEFARTTVVYAFDNGLFSRISDDLPGTIAFYNNIPCIDSNYHCNGDVVTLPWPIIEDQEYLKPATLSGTIDTCMIVEPGDAFIDTLTVPQETYMLIAIWKHDSNISVSMCDNKGQVTKKENNNNPVLVNILDHTMHDCVLQVVNNELTEPGVFGYLKCIFLLSQ